MFSDPMVKAVRPHFFPLTDWEPCTATVATDSGTVELFHGFQITVDPVIDLELVGPRGGTKVIEVNRTNMQITVVPDPEVPGSWVILSIKEELETD